MTGLNLSKDEIIEVACILTDANLSHVIKGPNLVINAPLNIMNSMDEWCTKHHAASGLTEKVLASTTTCQEAQEIILEFLKKHVPEPKKAILAGNSVHVDRQFLCKHMPTLIDYLHYRIVDVSTIKELAAAWYPDINVPKKKMTHRALDDIEESIKELKFYRKTIFKKNDAFGKIFQAINK